MDENRDSQQADRNNSRPVYTVSIITTVLYNKNVHIVFS